MRLDRADNDAKLLLHLLVLVDHLVDVVVVSELITLYAGHQQLFYLFGRVYLPLKSRSKFVLASDLDFDLLIEVLFLA